MAIQYTKEFKENAVRYWKKHSELGIGKCAKNLGIGNYKSDETKENARLRKELRDTQDALDILKKP